MNTHPTSHWLPTTAKEVAALGWEQPDVILFTGDAYVDHPSFGAAVIGRVLEAEGYRVAIVPQPNWRDDLRDFKKLGKPRLFFGVSAGNMDSMVNHYTANLRLRSDDAYTPGDKTGFRPDYAATVYTKILKEIFPDVPVVLGGIEASLRRLTHYDYWSDTIKPSILADSGADLLMAYAVEAQKNGTVNLTFFHAMHKLVVNLTTNYYTPQELAGAKVQPVMRTTARVLAVSGGPDMNNSTDGGTPYPVKTGANTVHIVAPQYIEAGVQKLSITIGNRPAITYTIPGVLQSFGSGEATTLNLALNRDLVSMQGMDVGQWNDLGGTPYEDTVTVTE